MSIYSIDFTNYKQNLETNIENKSNYGEIHTDFRVIEKMFTLLPKNIFENPNLKWLDPGCGFGYFSIFLFKKLNSALKKVLPEDDKRKRHIIENMIFMIEINDFYSEKIKLFFGNNCNFISGNYITETFKIKFDIIIGNPPFNCNGMKKVPTNTKLKKKHDGNTIWSEFIKKSMSVLKENGLLLFIVPSIWMRPDREKNYNYMMQFKLHKIHCFTNTQTNRLFRGEAQTPSCFFLMEKKGTDKKVLLYDQDAECYVPFSIKDNIPIPVFASSVINKILPFTFKYGNLKFIKTNMPNKAIKFNEKKTNEFCYPNIKTCILTKNKPVLSINYSNKPCIYHNKSKIVMAHGMYGFPFIDANKHFGISNRDKYVYLDDSEQNLKLIRDFFSTKFALYLFESTRYRMKYLEKQVFEFVPNILEIPNFPKIITDETLSEFFNLSDKDKVNVNNLHKKNYLFL